eukprot:m.3554 g.3554  ORF g.3554 m.3554 type:complete len:1194 (-) comp2786_c0_seq2:201-3782(-)
MSSSRSISIALWGAAAPRHITTCALLTRDGKTLATGSQTGHICLWDVTLSLSESPDKIEPKAILHSPTSGEASFAVSAITEASLGHDVLRSTPATILISATEDGALTSWDPRDGRCIRNSVLFKGRPTSVQTLRSGRHVVVCGHFTEVYVVDVIQFRVVRVFRSTALNWHRCGCLFPFANEDGTLGEGFISMCMDGVIEIYSLRRSGRGSSRSAPIKVTNIGCENALAMCVNAFTHNEILVVLSSEWRIYNLTTLALLVRYPCPNVLGWAGGIFYHHAEVLIWTKDGTATLFALSDNVGIPSTGRFSPQKIIALEAPDAERYNPKVGKENVSMLASFECKVGDEPQSTGIAKGIYPTFKFWRAPRGEKHSPRLIRLDATGTVKIWNLQPPKQGVSLESPEAVHPVASRQICEGWPTTNAISRLTRGKIDSEISCTATVMAGSVPHMIAGLACGMIISQPVDQVLESLIGPAENHTGSPEPLLVKMQGHTASVTCLLWPFNHGCHVDPNYLVSGSFDFTVRVWDFGSGRLKHTFSHHCGEISKIFCPPKSSPLLHRGCVCTISMDHSVAIFSLEALNCMYLIGGHSFPIQELRFKSDHDLLMIKCTDGTVNVWQLSTGHLDRTAIGQEALDIFDACDPKDGSETGQDTLGDRGFHFSTVSFGPGDPSVLLFTFDVERMAVALTRDAPTWRRPAALHVTEEVISDSFEVKAAKKLLCCILAWDFEHSEQLKESLKSLGLRQPNKPLSFNVCGEAGRSALIVPTRDSMRMRWCLSSSLTTTHLLTITSLAHCFHRLEFDRSRQSSWLYLTSWYTTTWGPSFVENYFPPALLPLASTWEHWQYDIQRVARAHLQALIHALDEQGRQMLVNHGVSRIPAGRKQHSDDKIAAVILLGVLAFEHRSALSRDNAILVSSALMEIVQSDTADVKHRAAAAEVLSRAYAAFEDFCDLSSVFVILTELAGATSLSRGNQDAVTTNALINFASTNPQLFVSTVNSQIFLPTFKGQASVLKVLKSLVKKQPMVLSSELPKVVDVVVRCFDPNLPKIREACFKSAMSVIHEMCPAYPMMSLFRPSYRLAVGGSDGLINIYDLKSATRWQAIPAHSSPITALAFSHDGKILASFSLSEKIIRVWHVTGSFFSMLGSAPRCTASFVVSGVIEELTETEVMQLLTLVWTDKKVLRLVARNKLDLKFAIKG